MTKEQCFVDVNNVDVMNYKTLLRFIDDVERIQKVPAGYAVNFSNVQIALTRHAFTLSLEGRIILEQKRDTCRWSDSDLLQRLGANRLVEFKIDPRYLDMSISQCKYGNVVRVDENGTCVGGLLCCLIFLDKLKQRHSLNLLNLTFRVPQREGFTQYYVNSVVRDPDCRYYMLDSTPETRQFVYDRLGLTGAPKEINRESLLVTSTPVDLDSTTKTKSYAAMFNPVFCVAVRGLQLHAPEITNKIHQVAILNESYPLGDKKFEDVLDGILPSDKSESE